MKSKVILLFTCSLLTFLPVCWNIAEAQTVSTVTEGSFYDGLGITSNGNIYCSNFQGDQVFKYEYASGDVTTFATGFVSPNGIGVDNNDQIYVCEAGAGRIIVFDENGNQLNQFTGLNNPTGIKYDAITNKMLWVSYNQNALYTLDPATGSSTLLISGAPLNGPSGIAFVGGEVFISNYNDRKIFKWEENQTLTEIAQLPANATANNVLGFLSSLNGSLFATQIGEHRLYRINPENAEVTLFAGSELGNADGSLEEATFNFPNGILGDPNNDRIYIADAGTSNLRIIDNATQLSLEDLNTPRLEIGLYPNPSKDSLNVKAFLPKTGTYTIQVSDVNAKMIYNELHQAKTSEIQQSIDISNWSRGVYFVKIIMNGQSATKQLIK